MNKSRRGNDGRHVSNTFLVRFYYLLTKMLILIEMIGDRSMFCFSSLIICCITTNDRDEKEKDRRWTVSSQISQWQKKMFLKNRDSSISTAHRHWSICEIDFRSFVWLSIGDICLWWKKINDVYPNEYKTIFKLVLFCEEPMFD